MFPGVLKKQSESTAFTAAHVRVLRVVSGEDGNGAVQPFLAVFLRRVFSCPLPQSLTYRGSAATPSFSYRPGRTWLCDEQLGCRAGSQKTFIKDWNIWLLDGPGYPGSGLILD